MTAVDVAALAIGAVVFILVYAVGLALCRAAARADGRVRRERTGR
jgi:hypothetical protein